MSPQADAAAVREPGADAATMSSWAKRRVKQFWEDNPCGARDVGLESGTPGFFAALEKARYEADDFMPEVVGFERTRDASVLEVGCGVGTDLVQFAKHGARVVGIDLTLAGAQLSRSNLSASRQPGATLVADGETLPLASNSFDLVYSWGVIHHTPDTERAAHEIVRVARPGGKIIVMVYNRRSLVALQAWAVYGLLRGRPQRSPSELISEHLESPGTKTFTRKEVVALFPGVRVYRLRTVVTRWDLRLGRRLFLPARLRAAVPSRLGWFMVLEGTKT